MSFRTVLASLPDKREKVVAEIWHDDGQIVEISNEHDSIDLELYPNPSGGAWRIDFDEFVKALENAKGRLLNK